MTGAFPLAGGEGTALAAARLKTLLTRDNAGYEAGACSAVTNSLR